MVPNVLFGIRCHFQTLHTKFPGRLYPAIFDILSHYTHDLKERCWGTAPHKLSISKHAGCIYLLKATIGSDTDANEEILGATTSNPSIVTMEVDTDNVIATVKLLSVKFKEASPEPVIRVKQPKRIKAVSVINKKVKTEHLTLSSTDNVIIITDTANNNVIAAEAIVDRTTKIGLTLLMAQKNLALLKTELGNLDYQLAYVLHQCAHAAQEVALFKKRIILLKAKASSSK
ncbi:unnamed protein product [Cyclocybe aegerita]|uniref:Uncharacterized protein n=1 Tax=Cyclocybe aegerita TaxID=1973307 RepID=A0A8S0WDK6_CYCAE|nr:unnamed protein product [Cyclocybe aegerita]